MVHIRCTRTARFSDLARLALAAMVVFGVWGGRVRRAAVALAPLLTLMIAVTARAQCPAAWVPGIGTLGTSHRVYALAVLPSGDVIVAGDFTSAGGVAGTSRIARYNPTTSVWTALGSGTNGTVRALAVLPGGDLIVGGLFTSAGGVAGTSRIARYNPTTSVWSALGSGTNNDVLALAVLPGGDVIAGGNFGTAGGVTVSRIARYSPTSAVWSTLGAGTDDMVFALAVLPGGDLIVGGFFGHAGDVAATGIARVNPNTGVWSALGPGTDDGVLALTTLPGGDVMVGGNFSTIGAVPMNGIARYNPTTDVWSAVGSGTGLSVNALAVLQAGDVIVGGLFGAAGGVSAGNLARYNPTTGVWSALGAGTSGVNPSVYCLAAMPGGAVIAGGAFTTAGGSTANRIARCFPDGQPPSIQRHPLPVVTPASSNAGFSIDATGGFGTGTPIHQWRKGGVAINTIANPSAATPELALTNVQDADVGSYDCLVTNSCGGAGVASNPATLSISAPSCPADLNHDGQVDDADFSIFIVQYNILDCADPAMPSNCSADLNSDFIVEDADFSFFVVAYNELLCP